MRNGGVKAGETPPEEALRRAVRALKTLSDCNLALLRARDESRLLQTICRIAVEAGGYRFAWVGLAEQDAEKRVLPVAQAGFEEGYLETVEISWADTERGRGPTGTAIRTGRPAVAGNLASDPDYGPWRDQASRRGYSSSIALPLRVDGAIIGALSIYAAEPDAFDEEEVSLLTELAVNLAYGLTSLRALARQQEAEEALRRFNERIVCGMEEGILVEDEEGRITFVNPKTQELLGYGPGELEGRLALDLVAPESRQRVAEETAQRPSGVASRYEILLETKGGHRLPVIVSATPLFDEDQFRGVLAVFSDIAEQKRAERALRDRNRELAALNTVASVVNQALDLDEMLGATLDTVLEVTELQSGWILLFEPGEEPATLSLRAHRGLPAAMQQPLESVRLGEGVVGRVAETGQPEIVSRAHDDPRLGELFQGREGAHACICVPVPSRESILGVLGVAVPGPRQPTSSELELLSSIGHQLGVAAHNWRLTRERSEVELLRELNRLRTELISSVSHELRTPLGLIKILASTLLREDVDLDRNTQRELLADIEDEADKLEGIVDNLLDLSRLEGRALRLDLQRVDVGQLARQAVAAMAVQHPQRSFVCDFPAEALPATLDARRIEQVLRNLLDNAVKYSPGGGEIRVQGRMHSGEAFVQVQDQGIGLPAEELSRVFERFYRVDNEVTRRARGAGLGLAVCQGIVEIHGGQIWAESAPGRGTTFTFTLPVEPMAMGNEDQIVWGGLL